MFNSADQVFVQLRSKHKDNGAGLWDTSAAGHVDSGESYLDCAVRELHEELGIVASPTELSAIGRLQPVAGNGFEFTEIYTVRSDQEPVLQIEEIDDGVWVSPVQLNDWLERSAQDFTEVFKVIWPMVIRT